MRCSDVIYSVLCFLGNRELVRIYRHTNQKIREIIEQRIWSRRVKWRGYASLLSRVSVPEALFVVGPSLEGQGLLPEKDVLLLRNAVPTIIRTGKLREWWATARMIDGCLCLRFSSRCGCIRGTISKKGAIWVYTEREGVVRRRTTSQHPRPFLHPRVQRLLGHSRARSR